MFTTSSLCLCGRGEFQLSLNILFFIFLSSCLYLCLHNKRGLNIILKYILSLELSKSLAFVFEELEAFLVELLDEGLFGLFGLKVFRLFGSSSLFKNIFELSNNFRLKVLF
jgi:hypothetical protein